MKHESPRRGPRATGTGPHQDSPSWPAPEGGFRPLSEIGHPITDDQVRALGFEPTRRGWVPQSEELDERLRAIDEGRRYTDPLPFRVPGAACCSVCGAPCEASTAGTPVCGDGICVAVLMHNFLGEIGDAIYTKPDGSGGRGPVQPTTPTPPRRSLSVALRGSVSVNRALERLVDCRTVLDRHGVDVRWGRTARCPFHDDEHPSMSLYERGGRSRAHCFPCDFDGDALDLEAALAGEDLATTIRRWS